MKWPRQYAYDFLQAKTKEAQKEALAGCPTELRELVKSHIEIARNHPKGRGK